MFNRTIPKLAVGLLLILILILGWTIFETQSAVSDVKNLKFQSAESHAQSALIIISPLSKIIPNSYLLSTKYGLLTIQKISQLEQVVSKNLNRYSSGEPTPVVEVSDALLELKESLDTFSDSVSKNPKLLERFGTKDSQLLIESQKWLNALTVTINEVSTGTKKWLVFFQNDDELRATGGFLGSYAVISFENGYLSEIIIEDVYDADGQFEGYISSPPGHKEYLSSDRGLRLPDANWFPDFPTSAATILRYFAYSPHTGIVGITTTTSGVAEDLLEIIGPVELPDYSATVTKNSLSTLLRETRGTYFEGSIQKKHILGQLFRQMLRQIANLPEDKLQELGKLLYEKTEQHLILAYSSNPDIQNALSTIEVTRKLPIEPFLEIVESNVGINKANAAISREAFISQENGSCKFVLKFENNAPEEKETSLSTLAQEETQKNETGYVQYLRLISDKNTLVENISYSRHQLISYSEYLATTISDYSYKEKGFLITVQPDTNGELTFNFSSDKEKPLLLLTQPGVPPYTLTINSKSGIKQILFSNDLKLSSKTCDLWGE